MSAALRTLFAGLLLLLPACSCDDGSGRGAPDAGAGTPTPQATVTPSPSPSPLNMAPVAEDTIVEGEEDVPVEFTLMAEDPDGDALRFEVLSPPARGALEGTAPQLTYLPDPELSGPDQLRFRVEDGRGGRAEATVTFEITAVNDAPLAEGQRVETDEDSPVEVLLLATDVDSTVERYRIERAPRHGELTGAGPMLRYVPEKDFFGDDHFNFAAGDAADWSAPATVRIQVRPVNDAPVVPAEQTLRGAEDARLPFLLTADDADGDVLRFELVALPEHGRLVGEGASFSYLPDADFTGFDLLRYRAHDGRLESAEGIVNLRVSPVPDAPRVPETLRFVGARDQKIAITLEAFDPDGDALRFELLVLPEFGELSGEAPMLRYTPNPGYVGLDGFSYRVSDGALSSPPAEVELELRPQ